MQHPVLRGELMVRRGWDMSSDGRLVAVVFVHGLASSPEVWRPFERLIAGDPELGFVAPLPFRYASPRLWFNPLRRIPSFDDIAGSLKVFLEVEAGDYDAVVLVSHSQGGLVVQRYLARMLNEGRGRELRRVRLAVLFACPNSGSELLLTLRRGLLPRHPQERELRPLNMAVAEAQRTVLNRVVHAQQVAADTCPIPVRVYAGEEDGVVTSVSARSVFPQADVLPGDHFTIVRPDSTAHRSFSTLRRDLLDARHDATRRGSPAHENGRGDDPGQERQARIQHNTVTGGGLLYTVQDGAMHIHPAPSPGAAEDGGESGRFR
ncbi:esterase/lipase family protein [Streptomyces sp. NPDC055243]|uniref:esterase/lipase family protein n=1 Tax=Streptomyces sp. NPDC055243 TaxID=3365720 RepID=UPI0037D89930